MNELTIARFLAGEIPAEELDREARQAIDQGGAVRRAMHVRDMPEELLVTRDMLLRLVDAALAGRISPQSLAAIAFALRASDRFPWSDDLVGDTLDGWSAAEPDDPIDSASLAQTRARLLEIGTNPEREAAPVGPGVLAASAALGCGLVTFGLWVYWKTAERVAALPLILGLLFLLPLAASRRRPLDRGRQEENVRRYRAAALICGAVWLALYAVVFVGNLAAGPSFVRGAFGRNVLELGGAFFAVFVVLVFLFAHADSALAKSSGR